jgi:acetylornithine deacetylase/succinyl-diaminopimelate desuccinylase family protein
MIPDVVETLRQLIRIPSVNPMGRDVTGEQYYERALTDYLEQFFQGLGVPICRQQVASRRDNILARIDAPAGDNQGSIVVFDAHQDTVPVDGMTIDPWEPRIDQGRVFGRGACDVKGAMACMLTAFARLAAERPPDMPTLIMACTVNEENGFTGARSLAQSWVDGTSPIFPRSPDQVIVAEPTGLHVVVTHKGVVRWRCHAVGRAAHSSCPDNGENAIYHMGHAVLQLQRWAEVLQQGARDPRLGPPTINVGTIHGGICVNAVPDLCTIEIDRRLIPEETPETARQQALDWLTQHVIVADRLRHDPPFLVSRGLSARGNAQLAQRLRQVIRKHGVAARRIGVPYGTNAPFFAATGVPTVVFGPGSIEQAHTAAEWVSIDQLHTAVEVYTAVGRGGTING